jgi:hypothetical protein
MDYQIIHCDAQGARLRRTNAHRLISALGVLFAALLGSIGGGMALFGQGQTFYTGLAFSIGAVLFAVGPALLIGKRAELDPRELIFDNEAALIVVLHGASKAAPRAFLPYEDAAGFAVRKDTEQSSASSSTTSTPVYVVMLKLKYGGVWDLLSYKSEAAAAATCALLTASIKLDKPCPLLPEPVLPAHFRVDSASSLAALSWSNPFPVGMFGFVLLFFGTFFALMYLFRKISPSSAGGSETILRIMFGVGLFIFVTAVWSMIRSASGRQRVAVTPDEITVQRLSRTGEATSSRSMPMSQAIGFGFDFGETSGGTALRVLDAEAQAAMVRLQTGEASWSALLSDLKTTAKHRVTIDVGMLPMAERLNVMTYLNRALRTRRAAPEKPSPRVGTPGFFFWESAAQLGEPSGFFERLTKNGSLGTLLIITAPLPLLILLTGALLIRNAAHRSLMLSTCFALQALACALAVVVAIRLLRAGRALIRAGLVALCALLVAVQLFLRTHPGGAAWPVMLLIPCSIAAGIALLQLPED